MSTKPGQPPSTIKSTSYCKFSAPARLGEKGLDYSSPEPKYRLTAYPEESFSGLQLMFLMYAGFKRIAPDQDTGMDLNEPWLSALGLFNAGK